MTDQDGLSTSNLLKTPEIVSINADEAYFDSLDAVEDRHALDLEARVAVEIKARHAAYDEVWQAGRWPLATLLADCRKRLERCAEHHGLASAESRHIRRLVEAIAEEIQEPSEAEGGSNPPPPGMYTAMTEDAFNTRPGRWAAGPVQSHD